MGLDRVAGVAAGLLAAGLPASTPAAAISRGTLPDQEVVRTTLDRLAAATTGLAGPTLLVIGDVAALAVLQDVERRGRFNQRQANGLRTATAARAC
jgi:uroporphyrin-III C-methyltransferase